MNLIWFRFEVQLISSFRPSLIICMTCNLVPRVEKSFAFLVYKLSFLCLTQVLFLDDLESLLNDPSQCWRTCLEFIWCVRGAPFSLFPICLYNEFSKLRILLEFILFSLISLNEALYFLCPSSWYWLFNYVNHNNYTCKHLIIIIFSSSKLNIMSWDS